MVYRMAMRILSICFFVSMGVGFAEESLVDPVSSIDLEMIPTPEGLVASNPTIGVSSCYDRNNNRLFVVWGDNVFKPNFQSGYYDANDNSWHDVSNSPGSISVGSNVFCCYDNKSGTVFAVWNNSGSLQLAYYDSDTDTWQVTPSDFSSVDCNISCAYERTTRSIIVSWTSSGDLQAACYDIEDDSWDLLE
jgi:hypothetical protein